MQTCTCGTTVEQLNADFRCPACGFGLQLPEPVMDQSDQARAFNAGSDARLAGKQRKCSYEVAVLASQWYAGWDHVQTNWARCAKRWRTRPLPAVTSLHA